jgi:NitT/TauT family transport system substrate-binding protein
MWLNVNKPELKSIRDFTDKDKIAVTSVKVSIPAILLQMAALKEWGPGNEHKLDRLTVSMSHPEALAAFLSKRDITAHFTSPPFMYREAQAPGVHRILSSDDLLGGPATFTSLYSSSAFHNRNPRTYKQALEAFNEALEFIKSNPKGAIEIYQRLSGDKTSTAAELEEQLKDPNLVFTATPRGVQRYADFMFQLGSIKQKASSWKDIFFDEIDEADGS